LLNSLVFAISTTSSILSLSTLKLVVVIIFPPRSCEGQGKGSISDLLCLFAGQ
jgi:hypothetical protein